MEQEVQQQKPLNKQQVTIKFNKLFEIQTNTLCFECGKKTRQWAQKNHAIFLCLNCAALYKQVKWATEIRSISLDLWTNQEFEILEKGGNERFTEFLKKYNLDKASYSEKLKCKAAEYYRKMLRVGKDLPQLLPQPTYEVGRQHYKPDGLNDLTFDNVLAQAKEKAVWLGSKTKEYGGKAYDKVHHKVVSGELKQDVKDAAKKVSTGAKFLWGAIVNKYQEFSSKGNQNKPNDGNNL